MTHPWIKAYLKAVRTSHEELVNAQAARIAALPLVYLEDRSRSSYELVLKTGVDGMIGGPLARIYRGKSPARDKVAEAMCAAALRVLGPPQTAAQRRAALVELIEAGLTIGDALEAFGSKQRNEEPELRPFHDAVRWTNELESGGRIISPGADPGAWVLAWVWVTEEEAGIEMPCDGDHDGMMRCDECGWTESDDAEDECSTCGADLNNGEGYDGLCGNCADRAEGG